MISRVTTAERKKQTGEQQKNRTGQHSKMKQKTKTSHNPVLGCSGHMQTLSPQKQQSTPKNHQPQNEVKQTKKVLKVLKVLNFQQSITKKFHQ